jgi:GAF domain-containing protein
VGVMAIQDYEREHQYGDQDVSLLSTIAAQVANAVENVRLLQRTRRWAQDLSALHGLSLQLAQEQRDLSTLLGTITRRSMDLLDSDGGGIWLWQPEDEELELVVTRQVGDTDFAGRRLKPGEGLTGRAFVDGQIRVVDDYLAWDGHAGTFDDAPFSSAMAVPMIWQNQMGGVLVLTRSQPGRPFLADEQNLAGLLASQAAAVMQNANLFEHARIRAEEQAMLLQVIEAVHRSSEMHALLESALEMVLATMRLDAGLVSLRNEETGDLYLVAHRGLPEAMARTLEQRGLAGTLCEYVLDTGQRIAIADVRQGAPVDVSSLIRHGLLMYAGTCLTYKGDRLGTCCFFHRAPRELTARELSLLEAIASQISVGVQNARLFEQTQAALSETAMLYRVARSLGQITDEREMFEFVLSEYLGSLDLAQGGVLIFDEDGQNATFRALMVDGKPAEPGLRIPVAGNPACEKLIATREPVVITDVLNDQLLGPVQGLTGGLGYKSMLLVPIVVGSRVVGALGADSVEAVYEFSSQDVALVRAVADQLGIAMENRRLIRETQAALAEVEATHRGYLRRAWQDHIRQREALHRSAFLLDRTGSGAEEDWSAVPDLWRPEMDLAVREGRHAAGNGGGDQERAGLAIPITLRGQTIGVLGVESPADDHQWTEDDVALIQAVGDQLAQALETARLFADTQRRAERERLIGEITTKIRASTDMRDILETAATELGRALGTSRALVRVGMEGLDPRRPGGSPPSATSSPAKDQAVTGGDE